MNITTRAQDFEMSAAIDRFVRDQVHSTLDRAGVDITAVDVFMKDINGPKGGVDKKVLFRVQLRGGQVIALEAEHDNLYAAIKRGAKRTRRAVGRQIRKARRIRKQRVHDYLIDSGAAAST